MEKQNADDTEYVTQVPFTPAPPRRGHITRPHTPGTPHSGIPSVDAMVEEVIKDSSGLP